MMMGRGPGGSKQEKKKNFFFWGGGDRGAANGTVGEGGWVGAVRQVL